MILCVIAIFICCDLYVLNICNVQNNTSAIFVHIRKHEIAKIMHELIIFANIWTQIKPNILMGLMGDHTV